MTRRFFGGDTAVLDEQGNVLFGTTGQVWDAEVGGTRITDLQDPNLSGQSTIATDANGKYHFWGPDTGASVLYVDFGRGRWRTESSDVPTRVGTLETTALTSAQVGVPGGLATLDASGQLDPTQRSQDTLQAINDLQLAINDLTSRVVALELHPKLWAQTTAPPHGVSGADVWVDMT